VRAVRSSLPAALFLLAAGSFALAADASGPKAVLPFAEDDYPGAMKQAKAKKLPVFIEAWAPW
jgi:hypothetical protein